MQLTAVVGVALVAAVICTVLKQFYPEYAAAAAIVFGVVILLFLCDALKPISSALQQLADTAGLHKGYLAAAYKLIGLCWISALGADICRDIGQSALASKVELAGRIAVLITVLPFVGDLLTLAQDLIGVQT